MKRTSRRTRKPNELSQDNKYKTTNDLRSASMSKEQMKKDWGSPRSTMYRKLGK